MRAIKTKKKRAVNYKWLGQGERKLPKYFKNKLVSLNYNIDCDIYHLEEFGEQVVEIIDQHCFLVERTTRHVLMVERNTNTRWTGEHYWEEEDGFNIGTVVLYAYDTGTFLHELAHHITDIYAKDSLHDESFRYFFMLILTLAHKEEGELYLKVTPEFKKLISILPQRRTYYDPNFLLKLDFTFV